MNCASFSASNCEEKFWIILAELHIIFRLFTQFLLYLLQRHCSSRSSTLPELCWQSYFYKSRAKHIGEVVLRLNLFWGKMKRHSLIGKQELHCGSKLLDLSRVLWWMLCETFPPSESFVVQKLLAECTFFWYAWKYFSSHPLHEILHKLTQITTAFYWLKIDFFATISVRHRTEWIKWKVSYDSCRLKNKHYPRVL